MFGFFKNLLRKSPASPDEPQPLSDESDSLPQPAPAPRARTTAATPKNADSVRRNMVRQNGRTVDLPLQNILSGLPLELQPRIRQTDVGETTLSVPLEKILAQLSRGVVKVAFGELRQALPEVFTSENDRDRVLVPLPLGDILSRLNPALITRRRTQRQVEVPAEISSPFDVDGNGLIFAVGPEKTEAAAAPVALPPRHAGRMPPPSPSPVHGDRTPKPAPHPAAAPVQSRFESSPAPFETEESEELLADLSEIAEPPAVTTSAPPPIAMAPVTPPRQKVDFAPPAVAPPAPVPIPQQPAPKPVRVAQALKAQPAPTKAMPPAPPAPPPAAIPPAFQKPQVQAAPNPASQPAAQPSVPQPAKPAKPVEPQEVLLVALATLAEGWPDAVRKEALGLGLAEAKVGLPCHAVEQALKQGRIVFSWKTLRSWIKPAVLPVVSAHDGTGLELPLKVVAPLFLARQRNNAKPHEKVSVDEEIPNLFFGFPQPDNAPGGGAATAKPADTNFYVWDDSSDLARVHETETKRGPTPGTRFVEKYATPNEIVSRAASLDGVTGALIALPDGLMVANQLPPDVNPDTLAAFLPQIFGKVSQSTKELRMGDLNNLNFTVGNVPWKIFRVNSIFFAAFGRAAEPLPTSQLAALAAELDHKPK